MARRRLSALAALIWLAAAGGQAAADTVDLYRATTLVTGQGEETRQEGFATCLAQVLVKVSGDQRLLAHPGLAAVVESPDRLVTGYSYVDRMAGIPVHDEQGTRDRPYFLTVRFDPAGIDAALAALGRRPWPAPRPRLAVLLAVRTGDVAYLLAGDGERGRDQRDALAAAAERFGVPVLLAKAADLADAGLDVAGLPTADPARLAAAAEAAGADHALAGSLVWSEADLGWVADWRMAAAGETHRWRIRGVSFDAAFRNAVAGAAQILSGNGAPD